ncbi:MAG: type II secretion system F family protein [Chloroflexota bacterium]|nr:type II secretion system F family protein [Chloroflexota bacterium]
MDMPIALSLFAFLAVFLVFFGLHRILGSSRTAIDTRLDRYASRSAPVTETDVAAAQPQVTSGLNRVIGSGGRAQQMISELQRADLKLTPSEFILINIASVLIAFLVALVLGHGSLIFGLIGGVVGFYLPRLYIRRLQSQRLNAFNDQLGDMLILLANALRSGYSLLQSLETVSKDMPPPMSVEFTRVVREIGLGLTIEEALAHLLTRIRSEDLDMVVTAINIQHEVGGNLSEILDTIAEVIRERVRIKGQIRALTASQRLSGNVVSLLPVALGTFLFVFNPNYLQKMFTESCGMIMLVTGGFTILMGYFAIRKITDIEV